MGTDSDEYVTAAVLSPDGVYRYELARSWGDMEQPQVCWVMLNPSTADAEVDDPTIRRCIGFSKAWGYGSLIVVNLYAYRATDPKALLTAPDAVGPGNDDFIDRACWVSDRVVCAWGTKGGARAARVVQNLTAKGYDLDCLALTKDGHPKHPLYVKGDTQPRSYRAALSASSQDPTDDRHDEQEG